MARALGSARHAAENDKQKVAVLTMSRLEQPILPLRFARRFQNGSHGTLIISVNSKTGAPCPVFEWLGPPPTLREELLEWVKACFSAWSNHYKQKAKFIASFRSGVRELWLCAPNVAPKLLSRIDGDDPPLDLALEFASHMLIDTNAESSHSCAIADDL